MSRGLQFCIACLVAGAILPATTRAQDARDVKPIATAKSDSRDSRLGPFEIKRNGVVVRSAEELVALTTKAKSATDPEVQKEMAAELAKLLKVDAIDWKKQMVLAVIRSGSIPDDRRQGSDSHVPPSRIPGARGSANAQGPGPDRTV